MNKLNNDQMIDISAEGDCGYKAAAGVVAGAWLGLKAGARAAPFLAWTGLGAGAIVAGAGIIGGIAGGLGAWGTCD